MNIQDRDSVVISVMIFHPLVFMQEKQEMGSPFTYSKVKERLEFHL